MKTTIMEVCLFFRCSIEDIHLMYEFYNTDMDFYVFEKQMDEDSYAIECIEAMMAYESYNDYYGI